MPKQAYVISDLHLGHGADDPTLEDFKQDLEFVSFVDAIARPETTLIINGDFIDFAQIPPYGVPQPYHLLWTNATSLKKLEAAFAAHIECFDALKRFVAKDAQLRIVIGNHDLDFAWQTVQARLCGRLGNPSGQQLTFVIGHTTYDGVWIEHGHAFTPENSPVDPNNFIHTWTGEHYLERVWGTDFLLQFFNDVERHHPFADKVKPTIAVIYYGLKNRLVSFSEFVHLILFLKRRGLPIGAITSELKSASHGEVSIDQIGSELGDPDWSRLAADLVGEEESEREFAAAVNALSPDQRECLTAPERLELSGTGLEELAQLEGESKGLFEDREKIAANERLAKSGVTHVVFGHTHKIVNGALEGHLFNPGTWIPRLNLRSAEVRAKIRRDGLTRELLKDEYLFRSDRLAVHIRPESRYQAHLRLLEVPSFNEWGDE